MNPGLLVRQVMLNLSVVVLLASGLAAPALAEDIARLTVELKVAGTEQLRGSGVSSDHAEGRFNDSYRLSVTTRSSGELGNVNVKDPQFAEKMMQQAAVVQRQAQRGRPQQPATPPLTQEQLEERAAAGQAACQGDINCLMKLAEELQAEAAAILAPAGPPEDVIGAYEEDDYRFLDYAGFAECDATILVRIDRMLSGEYADVQGMVPYRLRLTANHSGDELQRQMTCLGASLVVDVEDQVFYTDGLAMPEATGMHVRELRGRAAETSEDRIPLQAEISEWVAAQLRRAPLSGLQRATLPLGQSPSGAISTGDYHAQAEVELRWNLERGVTP